MKKKLVCVLLSALMVTSLAGCGRLLQAVNNQNAPESGGNGIGTDPQSEVQTSSDWDLSLFGQGGNSEESNENENMILTTVGGSEAILLNEDGSLKEVVDFSDVFNPDNGGVIGLSGNYVFFVQYLPNDYEHVEVYRYNLQNGENLLVDGKAPFDYYNFVPGEDNGNTLYYVGTEYHDEGPSTYYEEKYVYKDGAFVKEEGEHTGFFSKCGSVYTMIYGSLSYMTPITQQGNILVRDAQNDSVTYFVDGEGNKVSQDIKLGDNISIYGVDDGVIIYNDYGEDYSGKDIYCYNTASDEKKSIASGSFITFADGKLFYYIVEDNAGIYYSYDIYEYDTVSDTSKLLMTKSMSPYFNYPMPGISDFKVLGDKAYFTDADNDGNLVWKYVDLQSGTETELGVVVDKNTVSEYGKLEVLEQVALCPKCGAVDHAGAAAYMEYYGYDTTPEITDKINAALKKDAEDYMKMVESWDFSEDCEYMHPDYKSTGEYSTRNVYIINDKYLSVELGYYEYYGGAHGASYTDSLLFDLATGEQVNLMDLYSGSKEEFADIVAKFVQSDYENADPYRYFAEDGETVYQEAYDMVIADAESVVLTDKGARVVFGEYSLGPYASGQFIFDIDYDTLKFNL